MTAHELRVAVDKLRDGAPGIGRHVAEKIISCGKDGVKKVLHLLETEGESHIVRRQAFEALRSLGHVGVEPIRDHLDSFCGFQDYTQVYIAKELIRILGEVNGRQMEQGLFQLLERINLELGKDVGSQEQHYLVQLKVEIHDVLSGQGSECAIDDLIGLLGNGDVWVSPTILQAVGKIAGRQALKPLVRLCVLERNNNWYCGEIRKAFRAILRREGLPTDRSPELPSVSSQEKSAIDALLRSRPTRRVRDGQTPSFGG